MNRGLTKRLGLCYNIVKSNTKCFTCDMKRDAYTNLWDYAADKYGIITTKEAAALGVSKQHLVMMAIRGNLTRLGHGVYLVKHHAFSDNDVYAHTVVLLGDTGYLRSASVLAMHRLCPTNPSLVYVGATGRVRRKLPEGVRLKDRTACETVEYFGIRSQSVVDALRTAFEEGAVELTRIKEAARKAKEKGLIGDDEAAEFEKQS